MEEPKTGNETDFLPETESNYEQRLQQIRANEHVDLKFGYERYTESTVRNGWLSEMIDDQSKGLIAVVDFYFLEENGDRFKISFPFRPYLYLATIPGIEQQALTHLCRKYGGAVEVEVIDKEDLDLLNHLANLKRSYIRISFASTADLQKFKKEMSPLVRKNRDRWEKSTEYTTMLARHLGASDDSEMQNDITEQFIDIREHDIPYQVRVAIDLHIFVGLWYRVSGCCGPERKPSIERHPTLIDQPDPAVLAFDIETTKLPLKFPDSSFDEIMMISYMLDGQVFFLLSTIDFQGFLLVNRSIVTADVEDFEYTPRPDFKGEFRISNQPDEKALLLVFFQHIVRVRPSIISTYNGDGFDWPFVEARAKFHGFSLLSEIGFAKDSADEYRSRHCIHMDAFKWVKRDSYLPVGSQNLKACTRAKLRYDPVELDPEQMLPMAREKPQILASYSVSDAVATYYLYMKYVHPFIFALCTIIPMAPDDVLRKGSGTLCEALLMVQAFHAGIIFPNKQLTTAQKSTPDGHVLISETYVGGHVEALESGIFRADIPVRFRLNPATVQRLREELRSTAAFCLQHEHGVEMEALMNFEMVCEEAEGALEQLLAAPNRMELPAIYHLDVGAMYPNIILTNRLQPPAMITEEICMACKYNGPDAKCKRKLKWEWRGELVPASRGEYDRIVQQLETESFGNPRKPFHRLDREQRATIEKKRVQDFCRRAYGKLHITRTETRETMICQRENAFYVDTVRQFRDRRYEYKDMLKKAKQLYEAVPADDVAGQKSAAARVVLYESLQTAHKVILNSFYGYVMRRGSRWFSMEMAGIVCHTGALIIKEARQLVEQIGRPLELDTDGIWCMLPASFPQNLTFEVGGEKKRKVTISYPGAMLNALVKDKFTNDQYHTLNANGEYTVSSENSIFFEVDGPYLAMVLPASKEEGKKLKKRYAVFNFDKSLAELKGFEVKRRGELSLIKIFQSSVFDMFLQGVNLQEAYESVAKVADYWLDAVDMNDTELYDLISENRSMSKKLEEYGEQKSTSISTAKRLAEFLGEEMVKDAGLACRFVIAKWPMGAPVAERAIPLAIFQAAPAVTHRYLRKWFKQETSKLDFRDVIDWGYYVERLGGCIQKLITIPAALQGLSNPVPRIPHPDWLSNRKRARDNQRTQPRITAMFKVVEKEERQSIVGMLDQNQEERIVESTDQRAPPIDNDVEKVPAETNNAKRRKLAVNLIPPLKDGFAEWLAALKLRWKEQRANRGLRSAGSRKVIHRTTQIDELLLRRKHALSTLPWQIIQIGETKEPGMFFMWIMVHGALQRINLRVPRIFYVNEKIPRESVNMRLVKNKMLPRMNPVHNLYEYSVEEGRFEEHLGDLNAQLCASRIEGIYETQTPLLFRALVDLGCLCRVRSPTSNAAGSSTLELRQLEMIGLGSMTGAHYLAANELRPLFVYEYAQDTRTICAVLCTATRKAHLWVVNQVEVSLPNLTNLFNVERLKFIEKNTPESVVAKPDMQFEIHQVASRHQMEVQLSRVLKAFRTGDNSRNSPPVPYLLVLQSSSPSERLANALPAMVDFPLVRVHVSDPANMLSVLDWAAIAARRMIQHFFNSFIYLQDYIDTARYLHIPVGNVPEDTAILGIDLFLARHLKRAGHILWCSPSGRPDLGGKELDDARLVVDWDNQTVKTEVGAIVNKSAFENVLEIGALAVSALIQGGRIAAAEGTSEALGFHSGSELDSERLVGQLRSLASYDEGALVAPVMRLLRTMLLEAVRDIHANQNPLADHLVVNVHRWLVSGSALLYDPAITRSVRVQMEKLVLLLSAELSRMGARVLYASMSRIVLATSRTTLTAGTTFIDSLCKNLNANPLFVALHIRPVHMWNSLLWMDSKNYSAIRHPSLDTQPEIDSRWAIGDFLPEEVAIRSHLQQAIDGYHAAVYVKLQELPEDDPNRPVHLSEYASNWLSSELCPRLFHLITKTNGRFFDMPEHPGQARVMGPATLELVIAICRVLAIDERVFETVESMRSQLLKMMEVEDFSDESEWKPPGVSCVLSQMLCAACGQCGDVDVCEPQSEWQCSGCAKPFDRIRIETALISRLNQLSVAYALQDLRCCKCKGIAKMNMALYCDCSGEFENTIPEEALRLNLDVLGRIGRVRDMPQVAELADWINF